MRIFQYFRIKNKGIYFWIFFLSLFFIGAFFRLYNLFWGTPFFFHPDERNIASAVTRLSSESLNPEFFAYGGLPIYAIYFTGVFVNFFLQFFTSLGSSDIWRVSFEHAIMIGRVFSFLFSFLLLATFLKLRSHISLLCFWIFFALSVFSVGYIQYSHFGTFEMWLTFFTFLFFLFSYLFFITGARRYFVYLSLIAGVLLSIKISSVVLLPIPFFLFLYSRFYKQGYKKRKKNLLLNLLPLLFYILAVIFIFLITNPYFVISNGAYLNSIAYETSVATGELPVFYTGGFYNTIPVVFHFLHVFPFLINPLNTFLLYIGLFVVSVFATRKRDPFLLLTLLFFSIIFLSQAFLFVKWNRYMIPLLPFVYLIVSYTVVLFVKHFSIIRFHVIRDLFLLVLFFVSFIFSFSFFMTVYYPADSRVVAASWVEKNIPPDATIATEAYDLGITPFNQYFSNIDIVNTYDAEAHSSLVSRALSYDYIILPSQRVMRSRLLHPGIFPEGYVFYKTLFHEEQFTKIYETPCDFFCHVAYLGDPVFYLEETASVFDRPTVMIFKKQ